MTQKQAESTGQKLKISGSFAKRLKELREEKGVLQSDMAKMLGIATASYSNWEQGRTLPALTYLPTLASYFNVTTDDLLGITKQDAVDRVRERMRKLPASSQAIVEDLIEEMLKK
ncbi:MAG: helix-turn-helix domain-containing protein [Selenomonas sp.]|uniref:helix-turn-helix domain-containing protein n=1 Tax=Selenomonas sp. TaxID=2053611 RepID=UPI0025E009C1|nr:helix-turn-helix transcriptional regulator [Selenomonas sp.]MCR5757761.1 helix-turn-helix domain-containing protein [Selenomonas sp.]